MPLFAQLLLAQGVENAELLPQEVHLRISHGGQLHLHDGLSVGHHHGDTSEECLHVLWQLLSPGITGVHGNEIAHRRHQLDGSRLTWEHEGGNRLPLGRADRFDLHRDHTQHFQLNAVELIEATPQSAHAKSLEDLGHVAETVLIGAVGDDHEDTQSSAHVLRGLRLPCSGGPRRRAAEEHAEGLGLCHIAAVRQRRDDEALLATQVLV
mmetsp:Transcript_61072/g.142895  ORF Transcript_61072/g.142895 Transcript_61072/m.142895 type:complete len:209 (+) Transcript_61072:871-1497(+)